MESYHPNTVQAFSQDERLLILNKKTNYQQKMKISRCIGAFFLSLACTLAVTDADPVVFNVNMTIEKSNGHFKPGNGDTVAILGLNGDWTSGVAMTSSPTNPNVYTVTVNLPAENWPNYKFVIKQTDNPWIWEKPAAFGGDNRYFQVPAGGTNLPVVLFSDTTNSPIPH